jgi:hypothetical protein
MSSQTVYELIGYSASALVVISLAMSSLIRLRIVNLVGALVFSLYGVLIGSLPVLVTNLAIAGIDVWYLQRDLSTRDELTVVPVGENDPFLGEFVSVHRRDIDGFIHGPGIDAGTDVRFVMLRNAVPAGVFMGRSIDDAALSVVVDYVAPPYRDLRHGTLLYGHDAARFAELGYRHIVVEQVDRRQHDYFMRMGFRETGDGTLMRPVGGG